MLSFSETHCRENLFPFTLTRHTADIRMGIFTIREKWEMAAALFQGLDLPDHIPANIVPGSVFFKAIAERGYDQAILELAMFKTITYPWQLPALNEWAMLQDFELVKMAGTSCNISATNKISGDPDLIFIEEGAVVEHCFLNASKGPIYVGKNAEVMEGSMLRGPVSIGEGSVVKMGAAIYGATTIGPGCVVGGEVKNSIFFSFSNKAHEGYIGDAVIGSWCNLGAGTCCSNIRNTATPVKVWNMHQHCFIEAGLKCGLLMGDYSRCGINTSFNTGTVVGVSTNIFQSGSLQPKFIPSFSWGSDTGIPYQLDKAISDINNWMAFRQRTLTEQEIEQLRNIYSNTVKS